MPSLTKAGMHHVKIVHIQNTVIRERRFYLSCWVNKRWRCDNFRSRRGDDDSVINFGYEKQIMKGIGGFADVYITEMGVIRKRQRKS